MDVQSDAEKLRQRNRELSILNAIAQALNRSVDLNQALSAALAQVADLLDLNTGWVWLLDDLEASFLAATQNLPPALTANPHWKLGGCYCLRTYREGDLEGAANTNVVECSRLRGLVDGTDGLRYHASIPLYAHDGERLGVMNVASTDWRRLSSDDLQLLDTIGDLLGIAIERAHLFERSTRLGALEERNRLAREIHDTLAQGLTAVSLQLESADVLLERTPEADRARHAVQQALNLTRLNLDEARRSVMDLRAAPLEGRSLPEALTHLIEQMALKADCIVQGETSPLSPRVEAGVYRIAQEALANVQRHARATHVTVRLKLAPTQLELEVKDDGQGFDIEDVPKDRFGLTGISERVKLLDGRLTLESDRNAGTRLAVTVPLV